jgi:uncharacterized protein
MMTNLGWKSTDSPFHEGERAIQSRLGFRQQIEAQGRRIIRDYLPEQHRQFFAKLPYLILGTVDSSGSPWASILVGQPGFLTTPDPHTLEVNAKPRFGDPLATILTRDIDIGILGIELHTRRRNRLNGTVTTMGLNGFQIGVKQSFGNCPQYIQARTFALGLDDANVQPAVSEFSQLGTEERSIVTASDTFFIATAYQNSAADKTNGVDVAHRGGKPGFVHIDDNRTLVIPDFSGNKHFNTFGNLELNPRAGLLFVDFNQGDLLYLTGEARVIWDGAEINRYAGAERLLVFHLDRGYRVRNGLPGCWSAPTFSPYLDGTGSWS